MTLSYNNNQYLSAKTKKQRIIANAWKSRTEAELLAGMIIEIICYSEVELKT